jgi:nucleotide-binding universal stress UspA family protein
MKHLVVPVDFSPESLHGLDLAIMLNQRLKADIQLVYVQKKSSDYFKGFMEEEQKFAKANFEKICKEKKDRLIKGSKLTYIIKTGKVFQEVVNQADAHADSLIACSTHGGSGFEEFFIGSNAFKIISATDKPVMTIRDHKCPDTIRNIVLPIDLSLETRQKLPLTCDFAKSFGAIIHVVTVASSRVHEVQKRLNSYLKQTMQYLDERKLQYKTDSLIGDSIPDIVVAFAKGVEADLIAIMTEQGTQIGNFLLGNIAHQILNKAACPVLSVTPREFHIAGSFSTQGG